jgi:hypothetical protein
MRAENPYGLRQLSRTHADFQLKAMETAASMPPGREQGAIIN